MTAGREPAFLNLLDSAEPLLSLKSATLLQALDKGIISKAVLDVFHTEPLPKEDPFWSHPNVRLTPHTSFGGDGVRPRWDTLFLENIQRYVNGEPLEREVNPADL